MCLNIEAIKARFQNVYTPNYFKPPSPIDFTSQQISKPSTSLNHHITTLAQAPISLCQDSHGSPRSLFPLLLFFSTFSPQDNKAHLYTIQMWSCIHMLLKTTGSNNPNPQQGSGVLPGASLWTHLSFSWMFPTLSTPRPLHMLAPPPLCLFLSQIPAQASSLRTFPWPP